MSETVINVNVHPNSPAVSAENEKEKSKLIFNQNKSSI